MNKKIIAGSIVGVLFVGIFFLGRMVGSQSSTTVTQPPTEQQAPTTVSTPTTYVTTQTKAEENDRQLIENYLRVINDSSTTSLGELEALKKSIDDKVYDLDLDTKKDFIRRNNVMTKTLLEMRILQDLDDPTFYIVLATTEIAVGTDKNVDHLHYFITVENHMITDVRFTY